jgi:two-component system, LytTR family, sensor kinase
MASPLNIENSSSNRRKLMMVLAHILFWVCYISLPLLLDNPQQGGGPLPANSPTNRGDNGFHEHFLAIFFSINLISVLVFYANTELLMPRFFRKKSIGKYIVGVLLLLFIALVANYCFRILITGQPPRAFLRPTTFYLLMSVIGISTCYRLLTDYQEEKNLQIEREKSRLQSELSFLRSQISPHFMFNLMNSLAALARKKSDLLEPVIVKMSDLLRYMLYDSDETKVPIDKEVNYLNSYIELQKLRFGNHIKIEAQIDIQNQNIAIEPMLLIPFVENAFKHGTGYINDPFIEIKLTTNATQLHFLVKNRFSSGTKESKDDSSGIGLANVRRRMELLYPDKHSLNVNADKDMFVTELSITI